MTTRSATHALNLARHKALLSGPQGSLSTVPDSIEGEVSVMLERVGNRVCQSRRFLWFCLSLNLNAFVSLFLSGR